MKMFKPSLYQGFILLAIAMLLMMGFVHTASASVIIDTWQNATFTVLGVGSCSDPDGLYEMTIVATGSAHLIGNENSIMHGWAENGTYYIEPVAADSPVTYSGHYSWHFQENLNQNNYTYSETFQMLGVGSDGTQERFMITAHVVVTPGGIERTFDNFQWVCN